MTDRNTTVQKILVTLGEKLLARRVGDASLAKSNPYLEAEAAIEALIAEAELKARISELLNIRYIAVSDSGADPYSYEYGDPPMDVFERKSMLQRQLDELNAQLQARGENV